MKKEIKIPGIIFNQKYKIDENGNVWSSYRNGKQLHSHPTQKGYHRISLQTSEGQKTFQLHRLVLMTFNPVENMDKLEVNHKDGNKNNNNLDNLEWCTGSYNVRHSLETGLKEPARGTKIASNKLTEEDVLQICEYLKTGKLSLQEIGNKFGVSRYCIFDIKRKKSWAWLTTNYEF